VHVGLNLVYLVPGETGGMEVVARELIPALVRAAPGSRFTAFVNPYAARDPDAPWNTLVHPVVVPVDARKRFEWVRGEQQHVPRLGTRNGIDVLHSLASTAPAWGRFRRVVTIQDLIYRHYPEAHSGVRSWGMRGLVRLAAKRSHRVIAASTSTRDDILRFLGADPGRVDIVPHGLGATPAPEPTPEEELRRSHHLDRRRVVLSASAKRPHKNLVALLDALATMPAETRPVLILPGYPTWHEVQLREHADRLGVASDVRFLGWVSARDLEGLYAISDCFVFPSLYEGFGLPVLEAMRRGVPVACSNTSSLPEVAGDAALLFDPNDTTAIRQAMERLLRDRALAEELARRGRARAQEFSWDRSARETLVSYERALAD